LGVQYITTFTATVTDTVTQLPKTRPPGWSLFECEKPVELGWPHWTSNIRTRTVNYCYPRLKHTCQRDAKVAYVKFKDFCQFWEQQGDPIARECDYMRNYSYNVCPIRCNRDAWMYKVPGPWRCCPEVWDGMDPEDYNQYDELLCSRYRASNEDEYDFYTQNFAWFGIFDERFVYDNLTTDGYDFDTGERQWVD
jgi:hypothetical protein